MKIKLDSLLALIKFYNNDTTFNHNLNDCKPPVGFKAALSLKLNKIKIELNTMNQPYTDSLTELIAKYEITFGNNQEITGGNVEEFGKELIDLLNVEVELNNSVKITLDELEQLVNLDEVVIEFFKPFLLDE